MEKMHLWNHIVWKIIHKIVTDRTRGTPENSCAGRCFSARSLFWKCKAPMGTNEDGYLC